MSDKIININEHINKKDLELILEVNKKAIEIETEVADQNEEIISLLTQNISLANSLIDDNKKNYGELDEKMDKIIKQNDDMNKDIFKIQVLFVTGLLSLVIQIFQIFMKK